MSYDYIAIIESKKDGVIFLGIYANDYDEAETKVINYAEEHYGEDYEFSIQEEDDIIVLE
jgi:hypothetical protein